MSSLFLFSVLFNLFFSVYGYAFTNFPVEPSENPDLNIALDMDDLYEIGISFSNATSLNITFGADPTVLDQGIDIFYRVDWSSHIRGDYLQFQVQSPIERFLNTWVLPSDLSLFMGSEGDFYAELYNSSLVSLYEPGYDWIRGRAGSNFAFFLSPTPADRGNITRAIYETGTLILTYGDPISLTGQDEISIKNFISWYYDTLIGANSYGLPEGLVWFMRIIFSLNVIAGVFMLKELSRF